MKKKKVFSAGKGRTEVFAEIHEVGADFFVQVRGGEEHIGAVTLAEYFPREGKVKTSSVCSRGHKEEKLVRAFARKFSKSFRKKLLVLGGIHLDQITPQEIEEVLKNMGELAEEIGEIE